ncbi:MAG: site-specific DNA-methyltransferase [Rickettsiales bacterium]|nr:site-specific DNA-methyltransferase [Rickettsiales bacterium]
MIADNKLTENAQWDDVLLAEHFVELSELDLDFDLEITGFEMGEIDVLIEGNGVIEEEHVEEPVEAGHAVSELGDIWQLGTHRIICGDSLQADSCSALMDGAKANMVFTDPPYNVPVKGHISGLGKHQHREFAMATGEMSSAQFTQFLQDVCAQKAEASADGSLHYICMDWRHLQELLAAGDTIYSELKNLCIWVKDNGGMGSLYRSRHEFVAVFKHGKAPHRNNVELGRHGRYRTNVWEYAGANSFARKNNEEGDLLALHPTVKPVPLVADAILDCTQRGDIVLDAFLGSGSTLIAAEKVGRRCYGIELDPLYVDTAIRRWQQWTGDAAIHSESGKNFDQLQVISGGKNE